MCLNFGILGHSKIHVGSSMIKFRQEQSLDSQNASCRNGPKVIIVKIYLQ